MTAATFGQKALSVVDAADPLFVGNGVFVSSGYGTGCALVEPDGNEARVAWRSGLIRSHFSSLVRIGGFIYGNDGSALSGQGVYRCLDAATGKERWAKNLGLGSLCAAGDTLILLTAKGDLHIVEASPDSYREISNVKGALPSKCWTPPAFCRGSAFIRNVKGDRARVDMRK